MNSVLTVPTNVFGRIDEETIGFARQCLHAALDDSSITISYKKFRRNHKHYLSLVLNGRPINVKESLHWNRAAQTYFPPTALYVLKTAQSIVERMWNPSDSASLQFTMFAALDYLEDLVRESNKDATGKNRNPTGSVPEPSPEGAV